MNIYPIGMPAALDRIPGFHQYCLDAPRHLCYANRSLCMMLGVSGSELLATDRDGYADFLHPDDLDAYEQFLNDLKGTGSLQYRLISRSGETIHVIDTTTVYCLDGRKMADSVLADLTQQQKVRSQQEADRYLRALSEVYDIIFEFDSKNQTMTFLHGEDAPSFQWLQNIPMEMKSATESWIVNTVSAEDHDLMRDYFRSYWDKASDHPPRILYHIQTPSGMTKPYTGLFLKMDDDISFYCCRCCQDEQEAEALRQENYSLKNVQELTMQFAEGIMAFELEDNRVKPLFTSENIWSFFGYSQEQWENLAKTRPTIPELISKSNISYADIQDLLSKGEAEFPYFDIHRNTYRRMRAICSRKYDGVGKCYVMLYRVDAMRKEQQPPKANIRTFGYFDVFVGDKPIAFRNEKSKELFALLVDRKGGYISSEEAIGFLWEDEPANSLTMARYRKVALRLKNTLEEYGVSDIVESVNGKRRLIPERVKCDLYDYLSGKEEYAQLFKGSYLTNYSWGESTLAEMTGEYFY